MARNWTIIYMPNACGPVSSGTVSATFDTIPFTNRPCIAYDPTTPESMFLIGVVPDEHNTSSGTLKIDIHACANTTTAADDARIDVFTEFRTPGAAEALNADNLDGTADSGTMTFSTTAYSDQKITITLTPATTPAVGDDFRIKVERDADNGANLDDLAVDLLVVAFELYQEI
jgi:hypothetical protein